MNEEFNRCDLAKKRLNGYIQESLTHMGEVGKAETQSRSPVKSGVLKKSIQYETDKDSVRIGTNVEYAPWVHNGTSRQRSQPFLMDAIESHISDFQNIIKNTLSKLND